MKDFDSVASQIDTPFYINHRQSRTLETKKAVFEFDLNLTYAEVIQRDSAKTKPAERKIFDSVLNKDDRVLQCKIVFGDTGKGDTVIAFVGWRDGKPKIIGIRD